MTLGFNAPANFGSDPNRRADNGLFVVGGRA